MQKEEEARQQAAKDAKAQKAKERQAEIKRQAAELKARVKAEVEEVYSTAPVMRVGYIRATASRPIVSVAPALYSSVGIVCLTGGSDERGEETP